MIRLATLFADRLNLNGDQANLTVLSKRLKAFGAGFEIVNFAPGDDLAKLRQIDFLLIGHGSKAAWNSLESELERISETLRNLVANQTIVLAVSSGAEMFFEAPLQVFSEKLKHVPRRSKFVITKSEDLSILGYVNSDTDLPDFERRGSVMLTALHGPVLAKNPAVTDRIIQELGVAVKPNALIELLDSSVSEIWELERKLANE